MPIYEYVCMSCESHFEELVRHDETPTCRDCGSAKVQRQLSVFAAHGSKAASAKPTPVKTGGPAPQGGCGHGGCGCFHG
jgi:putative FmdB family regulatory protein